MVTSWDPIFSRTKEPNSSPTTRMLPKHGFLLALNLLEPVALILKNSLALALEPLALLALT